MPGTSRISGFGVLVMIGACFVVMVFGDGIAGRPGAWAGGFVFFGYMGTAHWWYAGDLFLGRGAARRGDFVRAEQHLEAALDRFEALAFVDRWRMFLLFSPTGNRFREAALIALAHCHALQGQARAIDSFERVVEAFPKSSAANASLMLLRIGAKLGARGVIVPDVDELAEVRGA